MKNKLKKCFLFFLFINIITSFYLHFFILKENNTITTSNIIKEEKIAYLTFDDGPSENTNKILEILDKYNIKATFFVVGPSYKLKNDLLIKIVQSGHKLAIHSYEHNYNYIYESKSNYLNDFYKCLEWIKETTGITPHLYRFPGGSSNTIATKSLIKSIIENLEEKGFIHADWNADSLDSYIKNDSNKLINNVLTSVKRNENNNNYYQTILMHDDVNKKAVLKALPSLIEKMIAKGYHFKSLTENSHITKHIK